MTKSCLTIALVSLLLSLRVCVAADPPATEGWYVYVDNQVPYGSEHVVKRLLANGDIECRIETRVIPADEVLKWIRSLTNTTKP